MKQKATPSCFGAIALVIFLTIFTGEFFTGHLAENWGLRFIVCIFIALAIFAFASLAMSLWAKFITAPEERNALRGTLADEEQNTLERIDRDLQTVQARLAACTDDNEKIAYEAFINSRKRTVMESLYSRRKAEFQERPDFDNATIQSYYEENEQKLEHINEIYPLVTNDILDMRDLSDIEIENYRKLSDAFKELASSDKIWKILSTKSNNERKSSAAALVNRKETTLQSASFMYLTVGDLAIPHFVDDNGEDVYIYPRFVIAYNGTADFTVKPVSEASALSVWQNFIVEDTPPKDAKLINHTWRYVNKNGQPDGRYANNPMLSVYRYANLSFPTLDIKLQFSKCLASDHFAQALKDMVSAPEVDLIDVDPVSENCPYGISEQYFDLCHEQAKLIFRYLKNMNDNEEFIEFIMKIGGMESLDSLKVFPEYNNRVVILMLHDFTKVYNHLEHDFESYSAEVLTLAILMGLIIAPEKTVTYSNLEQFYSTVVPSLCQTLKTISNMGDRNMSGLYDFYYPRMFEVFEKERIQTYKVLLYRFASLVAKADGNISLAESVYLSGLMKGIEKIIGFNKSIKNITPSADKINRIAHGVSSDVADAARYVVSANNASTSAIQRRFAWGYSKAGRIMDELEALGIVSASKGASLRDVLVTYDELEKILNKASRGVVSDKGADIPDTPTKTAIKPMRVSEKPRTRKSNQAKRLESLIGLNSVKDEVNRLTNFIKIQQVRANEGLKTSPISYHCVFTGNPGTGKTTVARIIAEIYKDLGILAKGHLVETDRSGLVAEYVGQTAVKTNTIIDSALDGILFIDEAYSLVTGSGNDFGLEAISTLLKRMEDDRDRLVVILAGYGDEMKTFIDSNPGLQSRFNRYIHFNDYSVNELVDIFQLNVAEHDYKLSDGAAELLKSYIENAVANKDKNFGNARFVRNLFEKTLENQASRLAFEGKITKGMLQEIKTEDIPRI